MGRSVPRQVTLQFDSKKHPDVPEMHLDVSSLVQTGDDLWLGSDETCTIERVSRLGPDAFGDHRVYDLADFLLLPAGSDDEEVDIEGLAVEGNYLWVTGSHSLKREKPKGGSPKKAIKKLAQMVRETNRYLLARIPIVQEPDSNHFTLQKTCVDPANPKGRLTAAQLFGTGDTDVLTDALREDDHLGRFLKIPGKENGFDIEGMEVIGDRIFLGLRGPVLRGWAIILEIRPEPVADHLLSLKRHGPHGALYRKHFLDLQGLGVRDLRKCGDDLLVMAGPTMDLDGNVLVLRWKNVCDLGKQAVVANDGLEVVLDFDFRKEPERGHNHAEGMTLFSEDGKKDALMVVYDSPGKDRVKGDSAVLADCFAL